MSEFIPGIEVLAKSKWASHTKGNYEVVSIEGPDLEGNYAAIIKDGQGRVAGFSYMKNGDCVDGSSDYNLIPSQPRFRVVYAEVLLSPLGIPVVKHSMPTKFHGANTAFIFDQEILVGSKAI